MSRFGLSPGSSLYRAVERRSPTHQPDRSAPATGSRLTFTGIIGTICWFPLRAIIAPAVSALRIHPNILTLVGVIINVGAAWAIAQQRFLLAGVVMICANIFDFIDGRLRTNSISSRASAPSGTRRSIASRIWPCSRALIYLYSTRGRTDYVMIAGITLIFTIATGYARPAPVPHREVQGGLHGAPRTHRCSS